MSFAWPNEFVIPRKTQKATKPKIIKIALSVAIERSYKLVNLVNLM